MKPNQIKSVFGLHTISKFKDNAIETNAFEMDIKAIEAHPNYRCESAKDDIGKLLKHPNIHCTYVTQLFPPS